MTDEEIFPPSKYRRDIMTYRYPIDVLSPDTDDFFFNEHVRFHVATHRMNEHDWKHRPGCFKHGCECRFCFPKLGFSRSSFVVDDTNIEKGTFWRYLDPHESSRTVYPYTIESQRGVGSQYLNTHSRIITDFLDATAIFKWVVQGAYFMLFIIQQNQHRKKTGEQILIGLVVR
jgi:hypothetical protein